MAGLSKSRISAFEQCPKRLWLSVHRRDLAEYDDGAEARFAAGHTVGEIACALHPGGVMVEAEPHLSAAVAETARLIGAGHPGPIFEATFEHEGVLVRVDVLSRMGEGWAAAEVKSSTRVKDYHYSDLATQVWVMNGAGLSLTSAAIRHIDTDFVLTREGDFAGLFADAELLGELDDLVAGRAGVVAEARAVLGGPEPVHEVGDHCSAPFDCEFAGYCHRDLPPGPEWPVTLLPYGDGSKWAGQGIEDLLDLSEDNLNERNARILAATRSGVPFHDGEGARAAMADWGWPRAWLDFETISFAVPRWIGTRPYQQIPFQFSLHLEAEDGTITHHEFLSCDGTDPRRACAEGLVDMIPPGACVIAYNAAFEKGVLRNLAGWFPDLAAPLMAIEASTVDLWPIARARWYHRDQRGSWSIKAVLPTIAPEFDYGGLDVKAGGDAQAAIVEDAETHREAARRGAAQSRFLGEGDRQLVVTVAHETALAPGLLPAAVGTGAGFALNGEIAAQRILVGEVEGDLAARDQRFAGEAHLIERNPFAIGIDRDHDLAVR